MYITNSRNITDNLFEISLKTNPDLNDTLKTLWSLQRKKKTLNGNLDFVQAWTILHKTT